MRHNKTYKILKRSEERFKHHGEDFIDLFKREFLRLQCHDGFQEEVRAAMKHCRIKKETYNFLIKHVYG